MALASQTGRRGPAMPTATYSQERAPGTRVARFVTLQNSTGETEPAGGGEITRRVKVTEETAEPGRRRWESRAKTRAKPGTRAGARTGTKAGAQTHRPGSRGRAQPALRQPPRSRRRHHGLQTWGGGAGSGREGRTRRARRDRPTVPRGGPPGRSHSTPESCVMKDS